MLEVLIGSATGYGVIGSLADDGLGSFMLPDGQPAVWLMAAGLAGILSSEDPAPRPPASTC